MKWLMIQQEVERIEALYETITAEQMQAVMGMSVSGPSPVSFDGSTARIDIKGMLVQNRDPIADMFGIEHTAYSDIIAQISDAESKGAERIVFIANSPGGSTNGMYDAMEAIATTPLKTESVVTGTAASAAYMLISQTGKITAKNELNMVGSVGVAIPMGGKTREGISNTSSPKKMPDMGTEDGKGVVRAMLDDVYGVLADRIAEGRGTTVENINANYGQGAVMTARTALAQGMIDAIETKKTKQPAGKTPAANMRGKAMDIEKLKAEHGDVYAAVFSAGVKAERDRVDAHLTLAEASGDTETAHAAIKSGDGLTDTIRAKHMGAEIRNRSIAARGEETPAPVAVATPVQVAALTPKEENEKLSAEIAAAHPGVTIEWR
jgi:ClpP class serine protease